MEESDNKDLGVWRFGAVLVRLSVVAWRVRNARVDVHVGVEGNGALVLALESHVLLVDDVERLGLQQEQNRLS